MGETKPPKRITGKWIIFTVIVGVCSGGFSGYFTAMLSWRAEARKEERERITAKIGALPNIVMHIEFNRSLSDMGTTIVANEGPVAASSLIVSVDQFFLVNSNGTLAMNGFATSRMNRRPWLFMTNSLSGGQAVEIPLSRGEVPNSVCVYHVATKFYPEFNLTTRFVAATNFIEVNGVAFTANDARRFMTNVPEMLRLVEGQVFAREHSH